MRASLKRCAFVFSSGDGAAHIDDQVMSHVLKAVPEIKTAYEKMRSDSAISALQLTQEDIEELEAIWSEDAPLLRIEEPGIHIVFEDILVPFVVSLVSEPTKVERLKEVLAAIEELAVSETFYVSNAVCVSFCEPIVTNQQDKAPVIIPYMGEATLQLCRLQDKQFYLSAPVKHLLGIA